MAKTIRVKGTECLNKLKEIDEKEKERKIKSSKIQKEFELAKNNRKFNVPTKHRSSQEKLEHINRKMNPKRSFLIIREQNKGKEACISVQDVGTTKEILKERKRLGQTGRLTDRQKSSIFNDLVCVKGDNKGTTKEKISRISGKLKNSF